MKKIVASILTLAVLAGCNPTRYVAPLEEKQVAVTANLGGSLINYGGTPMPIPLTSVGAGYGLKENLTLFGNVHTTSLAFGVFQTDIGALYSIKKPEEKGFGLSVSPVINWMIDGWNGKGRLYPQVDFNSYYQYQTDGNFAYGGVSSWVELNSTKAHGETQQTILLPSLFLGHTFVKPKMNYQIELRYNGFNTSNEKIVVDYISTGNTGTLGIYFGVYKKF